MKKIILSIIIAITALIGYCGPHHGGPRPSGHHTPPRMEHRHHNPPHHQHHHGSIIPHILHAVLPPPPPRPVPVRIWVPAKTILQGYDNFGRPIFVTIPGHWEYR